MLKPAPHKPGFRVYEYWDETSQFDPKGCWMGGSETYERQYRLYIPVRLKQENIETWMNNNEERLVWIDDDGKPVSEYQESST